MDFRIPRVGSWKEKGFRNLLREKRSIIKQFLPFKLGKVKHSRDKGGGAWKDLMTTFFPPKSAMRKSIAADDRRWGNLVERGVIFGHIST